MNIVELFKNLLQNQANLFLLGMAFVYVVLLIFDFYSNDKFPVTGFVLLLILTAFSGIYYFYRSIIPTSLIDLIFKHFKNMRTFVGIVMLVMFLISLIIFIFKDIKRRRVLHIALEGRKLTSGKPLLIVDRKNEPFYIYDDLYILFNIPHNAKEFNKYFKNEIDYFELDGTRLDVLELYDSLDDEEVGRFDLLAYLKNGSVAEYNLRKDRLYDIENKYYGYIISLELSEHQKVSSPSISTSDYLLIINSLNEPVAYFDEATRRYLLNNQMKTLVKSRDNDISEEEFKALIYPEDLQYFIQSSDDLSVNSIQLFRMEIDNKIYWFEFSNSATSEIKLIRRSSVVNARNKLVIKNHEDLHKDMDKLLSRNKDFGLISISFVNVLSVGVYRSKDISDTIISNYFKSLFNGPYGESVELYQMGNIEYGLLMENINAFESFVKDITDETSMEFKEPIFRVNEKVVKIELAFGITSSTHMDFHTAQDIVKANYQALLEATNPNYPKHYSIYYPKDENVKEYRFEDFDIDLSDKFLEKFKIDDE